MDISLVSQNKVWNTGKSSQFLNPKHVKGDFLVPYNWKVDLQVGETNAHFIEKVRDAIVTGLNAAEKDRIYFIGPYESVEDQSEAPTVQTLGYGKKVTTNRGRRGRMHTFDEGGFQYFRSVLSFRDKIGLFKCVRIDDDGCLWGARVYATRENDINGLQVTGFKGMKLSRLYPNDWGEADTENEAKYSIELGFAEPKEQNEDAFFIETQEDMITVAEEYGIQDVELLFVSAEAGGIIKFTATTAMGKLNLAEHLPELLVMASFVMYNETTSTEVDIDAVSVSLDDGEVTLTADVMDADYVAGDVGYIKLKPVATLALAGFKYYESNKMKFTIPAEA